MMFVLIFIGLWYGGLLAFGVRRSENTPDDPSC